MQFTFTKLPQSEVEIQVTIPFVEFDPHVKRAAVLISEEHEIEGFRKGRAPYEVVKNRFGEAAILERAAELAVRKSYPEILSELTTNNRQQTTKLIPIGRPEITITKLALGNEFQYKAQVAFLPIVELSDYKQIAQKIRSQKQEISVSDDEVEKTIQWIRDSRAQLITVDRAAQMGDSVEIDFEVRYGGVKIGNGESKNHPVTIGKGKFLPGFEDQLIGMNAGEKRQFTLVAPPDWHEKSYAGKALDFTTTMKSVQERRVPELTDEFVASLGKFSSVESFRNNVREGLTEERKEKEKQRIRATIIEKIAEESGIEVPDVLIHSELGKMLEELKSGVEGMGMKWEDYLLHIKKNPDELQKEWRPEAEKRVRIALCLREIADQEKITPREEEVEERANRLLEQYKTSEQAEKGVDPEELKEYARGVLRNEKVFGFLENV